MTTVAAPSTVRKRITDLAAAQITTWQEGYLKDRPKDVAALARLRRGAGRDAAELPDLWTLVDTSPLHERMEGVRPLSETELAREEDALHTARSPCGPCTSSPAAPACTARTRRNARPAWARPCGV
jgi:CRISPR system Cascade subunit CasB